MIFRVDVSITGENHKNHPMSRLKTFRGTTLYEVIERIRAWEQTDEFFKLTDESSCICHETVVGKNRCPYHGLLPSTVGEGFCPDGAEARVCHDSHSHLQNSYAGRRFKLPPRT